MHPFITRTLFPALPALAALAAPASADLPFEKIARDFLAARGISASSPEQVSLDVLLGKHYVHGRLGLFEVHFPVDALEKRAADLKECAAALLEAQARWLDRQKPAGPDQNALREDLKAAASAVKGWRAQALQRAKDPGGKDLFEILPAQEREREAVRRLAESMSRGAWLAAPRAEPMVVRLVLSPTRRDFVGFASLVGWLRSEQQAEYWTAGMPDWSQCFVDDLQIVALEYPVFGRAADQWDQGVKMNEDAPTIMQQQLVQLAMNSVLERTYADRVPALFVQGLSMNLVIDMFGEIATRVDGDLRSRSANAREVFIPGVASDGFLPKNSAESRWREDKGRDRFIRLLHLSQKEGEGLDKKLKNRQAGFAVRSDKGGDLAPVAAPFLGAAAAGLKPPPEAFLGDYAEMMRGYKCAFLWWLEGKAAGPEKASREKFAALLARLADEKREGGFESVFGEIYDGMPLSGPDAPKESLEGRFLAWLWTQSK